MFKGFFRSGDNNFFLGSKSVGDKSNSNQECCDQYGDSILNCLDVINCVNANLLGPFTINRVVMADGVNHLTDGTWEFAANTLRPVVDCSDLGDATHRIQNLFLCSTIDYTGTLTWISGGNTFLTLTNAGDFQADTPSFAVNATTTVLMNTDAGALVTAYMELLPQAAYFISGGPNAPFVGFVEAGPLAGSKMIYGTSVLSVGGTGSLHNLPPTTPLLNLNPTEFYVENAASIEFNSIAYTFDAFGTMGLATAAVAGTRFKVLGVGGGNIIDATTSGATSVLRVLDNGRTEVGTLSSSTCRFLVGDTANDCAQEIVHTATSAISVALKITADGVHVGENRGIQVTVTGAATNTALHVSGAYYQPTGAMGIGNIPGLTERLVVVAQTGFTTAGYFENNNLVGTQRGLQALSTGANPAGTNIGAVFQAINGLSNYAFITTGGNCGVGTSTPVASALLEMTSTTQGFLTPRMTTVQRDAIGSPATGLFIYNTTTNKFNFYNGVSWEVVDTTTGGDVSGSGTTGNILKWSDGPGSVAADSILSESGTDMTLAGRFLPEADDTRDLGSLALRWRDLYLGSKIDSSSDLEIAFSGGAAKFTLASTGRMGINITPSAAFMLDIATTGANGGLRSASTSSATAATFSATMSTTTVDITNNATSGKGIDISVTGTAGTTRGILVTNTAVNVAGSNKGIELNVLNALDNVALHIIGGELRMDTATGSRVLVTDASRNLISSSVTSSELAFLAGSSVTAGGIVFGNGTKFTQDDANLFWDDANNRLGVGTASPASRVHIEGASANNSILQIVNTDATTGSDWRFSIGNPGNFEGYFKVGKGAFANDYISAWHDNVFEINTGKNIALLGTAFITSPEGGTFFNISFNTGTYLHIGTATYTAFHNTSGEAMRLDASSNLGIGTATPSKRLDIIAGATGTDGIRVTGTNEETTIALVSSNTNYGAAYQLQNTGLNGRNWKIGTGQTLNTAPVGSLWFFDATAGADRFVIDSEGRAAIGSSSPDASAKLDITSTTQGFLPPRMTTAQRNAITLPAKALLIYNTTTDQWEGNNGTPGSPNWVVLG